ncbi:VWA domain-containing protein [Tessaracoccus rhinocerotis]|uniref:VWA domain-containing protein n=1 Tax=Tessaracoccus rhinocerotis TaxID=1689449 RepID=A0A553JWP3_9ACTN|nr:VWA domain-containing protein [Tessaracoccus rhinocerotis]TRY16862.1 VWA domain-containing protein [Tessaracoccus rhinocerotis]
MSTRTRRGVVGSLVTILLGAVLAASPMPWAALAESPTPVDYGPLAVVLDLSGSMNDDDGTGTIKLDGAKEALVSVVRTQAARGDQIRLWTYPGPEDDCAPGSWVSRAGEAPTTLVARINSLTAIGGTPTGPALREVADDLKSAGHDRAVLLLVSDGLSNCGTPPCEVAQDLVNEGFQLTVQAMGFQVDTAGRRELECIANATDGSYYDAEDADDLIEKIEEYGVPRLELDVDAPGHVASGDVVDVTVTVANNSVQPIQGVTLSMRPQAGDATTIFPAVIPPVVPLGNLPPETAREYRWQLPIGSIEVGGTVKLTATASSTGFVTPASQDVLITALGPDFDVRTPTWLSEVVASGSQHRILIFGDSYSSGEGAGKYYPETMSESNNCHKTRLTYLAYTTLNTGIVACSGAMTYNLTETGQYDQPPQVHNPLVANTDDPVEVAFMTMGGNNVQFADILTQCLVGSDHVFNSVPACDDGWGHVFSNVAMLQYSLRDAYEDVYTAINTPELLNARDTRVAPLVILPYPNLVPARATGKCGLDPDELRFAQALVNSLNSAIENAVNYLRADGMHDGIIFASQVRTALGVHGMCTEDPHFNTPTIVDSAPDVLLDTWDAPEWGHLDARGYMDVTRAIQNWSFTQDLDPADIFPSPAILEDYIEHLNADPDLTLGVGAADSGQVRAGDPVRVVAEGMLPGSPAVVAINSVRVALLSARADESGRLDEVVLIPADVELGQHRITVSGFDPSFSPHEETFDVRVGAPEPWWFGLSPYVALGLVAAGLIALLVWFVARRRTGVAGSQAS